MVCTYCGSETKVVNSRLQKRLNQVWRRRKCLGCGAVFSTHEAAKPESTFSVRTVHGKLSPFQRDKVFLSIFSSCQHRKTALSDATALTDTIVAKAQSHSSNGVIDASDIVAAAESTLKHFDQAAWVHYRAFHPIQRIPD